VEQLTDSAANRRLQRQLWIGTAALLVAVLVIAALVSLARPVAESKTPVLVNPSADYGTAVTAEIEPATAVLKCSQEDLARVPDRLVYNPHTRQYVVNFYGEALVPEAVIVGSYTVNPDDQSATPVRNDDLAVIIDPTLREIAANDGILIDERTFAGPNGDIVKIVVCRIAI
jgi:hypothetical protein